MRTRTLHAVMLGVALAAATASLASASPITFNFSYAGQGATAVGSITFESTLIANPGINDFSLPNPAVLALTVTVSGASTGNGTFGIGSFDGINFDTGGATLNFAQDLVGQATPGGPWGTPSGCCGDFNLFTSGPPAPNGVFFFTLAADDGDAAVMTIKHVTPATTVAPAQIPALEHWKLGLLALLVAAIGIVLLRRRGSVRWTG
jgi:hypothetical protein